MNKERYDRLTAAGIQIEEALERFMDSEAMFERSGKISGRRNLPSAERGS